MEELPQISKLGEPKNILDAAYDRGYAKGLARGYARVIGNGPVKFILEMMNDGEITPAQARARLMSHRKLGPNEAHDADAALEVIGNRE